MQQEHISVQSFLVCCNVNLGQKSKHYKDHLSSLLHKRGTEYPQGSQLRGWPKNRWWNCVQTDIDKKIKNWKEVKKQGWLGKSIKEV